MQEKKMKHLQEGMTGSIAKVLAMGLKRKVIGIGNQVQSATDLEEKINLLSKQINVIAGLVLTTISVSDEKGLLSVKVQFLPPYYHHTNQI